MTTIEGVNRMDAERGPRWLVYGKVRAGEYNATYCVTAEQAEQTRDRWASPDGYNYGAAVWVVPPDGSVDLAELGRNRRAAQAALDEATSLVRAGVLRALEANRDEAEVARAAGVDRQTVRAWAGKQPANRRRKTSAPAAG